MPSPLRRYTSARGFQAALKTALKNAEAHSAKRYEQLQREFYLQRFLARVFAEPDGLWVLKGGTNMLARFPATARHSQDIDLLYRSSQPDALDAAVLELRALSGPQEDLDPLNFAVGSARPWTGGVRVPVTAYFGASTLSQFPVDIVADLPVVAAVERRHLEPAVRLDACADLPAFTLYPMSDQVADKLCAMYEHHGKHETPSSRYRDLVDLLIVITNHPLDAKLLAAALRAEAHRRQLVLPHRLEPPGTAWRQGYREEARRSGLPTALRTLDAALTTAACLDPVLGGTRTAGTWQPQTATWKTCSDAPR